MNSITTPQVRPFVRLVGRGLDNIIFLLPTVCIVVTLSPAWWVAGIVLPFLLEALCLSFWCTTPAKFFLNTRVTDLSGQPLTFGGALKRTLLAWSLGSACDCPALSSVTKMLAYGHLCREGQTRWDRKVGSKVVHGPLFRLRVISGFMVGGAAMAVQLVLVLSCFAGPKV